MERTDQSRSLPIYKKDSTALMGAACASIVVQPPHICLRARATELTEHCMEALGAAILQPGWTKTEQLPKTHELICCCVPRRPLRPAPPNSGTRSMPEIHSGPRGAATRALWHSLRAEPESATSCHAGTCPYVIHTHLSIHNAHCTSVVAADELMPRRNTAVGSPSRRTLKALSKSEARQWCA